MITIPVCEMRPDRAAGPGMGGGVSGELSENAA